MNRWRKIGVLILLFGLLFCATIIFGTLQPNPDDGRYPGAVAVSESPENLLGDKVTIYGNVVSTDPVVIRTGGAQPSMEGYNLTLAGQDIPNVKKEYGMGIHGTLISPRTVDVDGTVVYEPGDLQYAKRISFIAGVLVLLKFLSGWTFDLSTLTFQPRSKE